METKLWGWQVLFLIEGAFTVGFGVALGFFLPWSTDTASFLNEREKQVARMRILKDGSDAVGTKFNVKKFFKPLTDWKVSPSLQMRKKESSGEDMTAYQYSFTFLVLLQFATVLE